MKENKTTIDEMVQSEGWKKMMNRMDLYCSFLLCALIIFFLTGYTNNRNFRLLTLSTLMIMATIGFFMAFNKFQSESTILSKLFYKVYGMGLSISFITLLAVQQVWKLPTELFSIVSIILLFVSLILGIREIRAGNRNNLNWKFFTRIIIALIPIIYLIIQKISL
jgi:hypothetical protein